MKRIALLVVIALLLIEQTLYSRKQDILIVGKEDLIEIFSEEVGINS